MHDAHDLATLGVTARRARLEDSLSLSSGPLEQITAPYRAIAQRATTGLFRRDASVWSASAETQRKIANRLGWLDSPEAMLGSLERLRRFADQVKRDRFEHVVLLGMGGSSLAPEVLRAILGVSAGSPRFQMLDSTDPAAIRAAATPPGTTLYVLASKSGTTIEPNSLAAHFRAGLEQGGVARWADHFVAITDEGTALAARARQEGFRDLFVNPSDIGGRYSALSLFGLVPAALMGHDLDALVAWAIAMLNEAAAADDPAANPAVGLGLALGSAARAGRDKATLVLPPVFEPFGLWVEQLVAESTGKQGVGVVPVAGEPVGPPEEYGRDRLFVHLRLKGGDGDERQGDAVSRLRAAEQPIATIDVAERAALGAEFLRWEIATAVAAAILDINPFDEPNVQQAKDATRVLLDGFKASGRLPEPPADATLNGARLTLTSAACERLVQRPAVDFLSLVEAGDYFAILAYLGPDEAAAAALAAFREGVRRRARAATTFGYGPRYLHSTGQLHKGGANNGVFLIVTASPDGDLEVPGEAFSFSTLELAQAAGDFNSLEAAGRRALHLHLPSPDATALRSVLDALLERL